MSLTIHTDGGSLNNPGQAAIGFLIHQQGVLVHSHSEAIGIASNNVAEYTALIRALEYVNVHKNSFSSPVDMVEIVADSELMVKQMQGKYRVKNADLKPLFTRASELAEQTEVPVSFRHVLRHENSDADRLVKQALGR